MSTWNDLPSEIKERVLDCQEEQGNIRDESVFQNRINTGKSSGGIDWDETKEGYYFWNDVLYENNIDVFYEKYPKQLQSNKKGMKRKPSVKDDEFEDICVRLSSKSDLRYEQVSLLKVFFSDAMQQSAYLYNILSKEEYWERYNYIHLSSGMMDNRGYWNDEEVEYIEFDDFKNKYMNNSIVPNINPIVGDTLQVIKPKEFNFTIKPI